jgi:hypothetical protein
MDLNTFGGTLRKRKRRHQFGTFNPDVNKLLKEKKGKKFHVWKGWMVPF